MERIQSKQDIFHLASPIQLNRYKTTVYLEDFFLSPEKISTIHPIDGLEINFNKDLKTLEITVQKEIKPLVLLKIEVDNECYTIPVLKCKKIIYHYIFDTHGGPLDNLQIAGDFNNWNPHNYNFQYNNGVWEIFLELEPGNYPYQLISNGNWFNDPNNPFKIDNGYGNFNSLLKVRPQKEGKLPEITTEKSFSHGCVLSSNDVVETFIVIWQNKEVDKSNLFRNNEKLLITIPAEAYEIKRSFLRVWAYNECGLSNDLLIPLEKGKVVSNASFLDRNDKENQIIFFLMVDRFFNGNPSNDNPIKEEGLPTKLNYYGGDIAGITKKIKDGYLKDLGVNTLWISPVVQNPEHACMSDGQKCSGYHGYWPTISTKVDHRFGNSEDMKSMVNEAHKNNLNIILDFVANHVHEDNEIIKNNPDWATPLHLPDGSLNIGRWEEHRLTTWFDHFLPTLNYDLPEVVDTMTEFALFWIDTYNLDGFRHDATKHIPDIFWRKLTQKLKQEIMCNDNKRLYQIGETFGGRDLLKSYVNSGMLDGQFSFNLYYEVRAAFCFDNEPFDKLTTALDQDLQAFGFNHLMGNISGNHDLPRFISYAGEDLTFSQNAKHEGWVRHITVKNPIGYKKLSALTAFICTIPGIPVIYYGDEIGIAGGADPDNRRPMRFEGLNNYEKSTFQTAKKIIKIRKNSLSLIYGNFIFLNRKGFVFAFCRKFFNEASIVVFNKSNSPQVVKYELPEEYKELKFFSNFDSVFEIDNNVLTITLPNHSFEILSTLQFD